MYKIYPFLAVIPLAIASTVVTSISQCLANLPPLIPRQTLFGNPERTNPQLSPDGKYLSYIAPNKNNVLQVWVRTVGKEDDQILTTDKKRGIRSYFWTYNPGELVYLQDADGDENFHLYVANIKSKQVRDLTPFKGVNAELIAAERKFPNEILVGLNIKDPRKHDAYRINLSTDKSTLEMVNPGTVEQTVADPQMKIRAVIATIANGGKTLSVRETVNQPWKTVRSWGPDDEGSAVNFSDDGKTLYIESSDHANATRLLSLNIATGKESVVAQDQQYDIGGVLVHPLTRKIQAVSFYKDKLAWQILDKSIAPDFQAIAKVHRGEFKIVARDLADKTWLVGYNTDDGPVYYYVYDRASKKSQLLFNSRPKLEKLSLAKKQPISYKSRDGLTIHGYLTTPVGIPSQNLPAVILVHGDLGHEIPGVTIP
ncbi:hypothetical protein [Nostoc sp. KVJ3]|uniref:S9 family peptidase n=1 Tax=Nostoc sp. KVJ3 TaxID=457945 RepID=UPI0022389EA3|nr:hypothetical protein [Nostoc sp. KVJ3]